MMVESRRRNLALASQGAQLVGELGRCDVQASKPLLRYDVAFPEWPEDLASDQVAGVPGQCEGVRDLPQALPVSFGSAAEFQEHLKSVDAAWEGDCRQSTFLPNPAEVVIRLPGEGSFVEKVGFTYSPWDRNYGRVCQVCLSADGEAWTNAGEVQIPYGSERGDPSRESTATLFVDVPAAMREAAVEGAHVADIPIVKVVMAQAKRLGSTDQATSPPVMAAADDALNACVNLGLKDPSS
ncbi:unnamed protein product [Prorocentrum cordatum]|uniref:F5/8 type C domain-containing protein n=1 Tax=Prorocentrum cordatum TaxID=2364126 RepID=A0ABN9YIU8_9DINO|nr:unnamed protein product [Polarella glacialis]